MKLPDMTTCRQPSLPTPSFWRHIRRSISLLVTFARSEVGRKNPNGPESVRCQNWHSRNSGENLVFPDIFAITTILSVFKYTTVKQTNPCALGEKPWEWLSSRAFAEVFCEVIADVKVADLVCGLACSGTTHLLY